MSGEGKLGDCAKLKNEYQPIEKIKDHGFGHRHLQAFLTFIMVSTLYIVRTSMSVSIVAMTDKSRNDTLWEIYDWDKKTQDYILGSFFVGYTLMQIPAGQMAQRFGGKILIVCAMFINGLLYVVIPYVIRLGGWKVLCLLRIFQGAAQSCMMPSVHTLLGKWAPVNERSRLGFFTIAGCSFGTIIGLPLCGVLCENYGWKINFIAIGIFALIMGLCFLQFGYDSPAKHPKISNEEKFYIQSSLGQIEKSKRLENPWKSIVTSVPVWALLCTQAGGTWSLLILLLETPSFMKMALGINMKESSLYSALPFIAMWCFGILFSIIADILINRNILSITNVRKLFNSIGTFGTSIAFIILSYLPTTNIPLCLTFLILATGLLAGTNAGYLINHIDLSPNFAGLLMGITNSIANGVSIGAPISAGMILKDTSDPHQWRTVFFTTAVISSLANVAFLIFGSGKTQKWNQPEEPIQDKKWTTVSIN